MKKIDYINQFGSNVYEATEYAKSLHPEYPAKPVKPIIHNLKSPSSVDYRDYAVVFEKYEKEMVEWKIKRDEYQNFSSKINSELVEYIKEVAGLNTIPEKFRDKVWNKAYEDGHAYGYTEVYYKLLDLVDIFN